MTALLTVHSWKGYQFKLELVYSHRCDRCKQASATASHICGCEASSAFHNKLHSLCLGAKILPREYLVCPRIWCTWYFLLKTSAWTFSFSASQYASNARTAVLIQVWYGTPMSHLLSQMAQNAVSFLVIAHQKCKSTYTTLFFVLLCERLVHPSCTHFPITQTTTDSVTV